MNQLDFENKNDIVVRKAISHALFWKDRKMYNVDQLKTKLATLNVTPYYNYEVDELYSKIETELEIITVYEHILEILYGKRD